MYKNPVNAIEKELVQQKTTCVNLDYLKRVTKNNAAVIAEMIEVYLEETPRLLDNMKQAIDAENWETLKLIAHSIIPSFSTMGIDKKFENKAKKIQEYAISLTENNSDTDTKKETIAVIHDLFLKIKSICTQSCEELEKELLVVK